MLRLTLRYFPVAEEETHRDGVTRGRYVVGVTTGGIWGWWTPWGFGFFVVFHGWAGDR